MTDWSKWLEKHELSAENILYLYRQSRRTVIHREDGEEFTPFAPLQVLLALLPEADFLRINKGVAVNRARIINIDTDGVYTLSLIHILLEFICLFQRHAHHCRDGVDVYKRQSITYVSVI